VTALVTAVAVGGAAAVVVAAETWTVWVTVCVIVLAAWLTVLTDVTVFVIVFAGSVTVLTDSVEVVVAAGSCAAAGIAVYPPASAKALRRSEAANVERCVSESKATAWSDPREATHPLCRGHHPNGMRTSPAMSSRGLRGLRRCRSTNHPHHYRHQEEVVTSTKTRINKIDTVVIPVSKQDEAIEFYVETLGFEKRVDIPFGNGYRWVEVAPGDTETTIALAPPPEGKQSGNRETGIGLQTDDIDSFHAELKSSGVDVDAEVSRMGDPVPPLFWLRDPEGNSLMVVG
jgi:catechol 2,3-dioxygenase-like lactoylglutathione lyase family enzyme